MTEVRIDGVLYVPVSEAHIDAPKIVGALIEQWWGDHWADHLDQAHRLRVVVGDGFEDDEGETLTDFAARVVRAIDWGEGDG